jgi:hypothetical protein
VDCGAWSGLVDGEGIGVHIHPPLSGVACCPVLIRALKEGSGTKIKILKHDQIITNNTCYRFFNLAFYGRKLN